MKARRLLDESPDPLSAALLRSWAERAPEPGAITRAASVLGVSAAAMAPAAALGATATAATVSSHASLLVIGKWFIVGLAGGAVVLGSAEATRRAMSTGKQTEAVSAQVSAPPAKPSRSGLPGVVVPVSEPEPASSAGSLPVRRETDLAGAASATRAVPSIRWEIAALDRARQALSAHDPAAALRSLDHLEHKGPSANFDQEAALLRIEALGALGRHTEASTLTQKYLDRYPDGPGSARMRALIKSQTAHQR